MSASPVLFRRLGAGAVPPERAQNGRLPSSVFDVLVVGAGVVGLSIGWRLAARGLSVALIEAGRAGGGTSSAATGMLAAAAEHEPGSEALLRLGLESQALWPAFRDGLEAASGLAIDYRRDGTLVVAVGRDETDRLRARHDLQRREGLDTRWLSASAARDLEPGLRPSVTGGIFCPADHAVDPALLLRGLETAFRKAGGHLIEGRSVEALERTGRRVTGVTGDFGTLRAATVVLATGATIGSLPWLPPQVRVPVRPLKGQAMALRARCGPLPIRHVVWTSEIHLAPKSDGRLILGATMEDCGFDTAVTAGGLYALLDGARRVLPGVEEMAIESVWTGFRPTSDDDAPIFGPTAFDGLLVAAGHHRNGYLLAPVTAQAIEDCVTRGTMRGAALAFGLGRFEPARREGAA